MGWNDATVGVLWPLQLSGRADRILHAHYTGTCSLSAGVFQLRFFHRLGATEVEPDTICNNAGKPYST